VEARGRGPRGETLEGGNARRGSAVGSRVTPAQHVRTFRVHQSLELRLGVFARREKRHEGQARREAWRLPEGETLCKRKPRGVTGMKQSRKDAGGTKRQEVEKTWRRSTAG
jgi:hypothetical protein